MKKDEKAGILYKEWKCRSPRAVFLLVHGLGAFSGRWDFLADFFLREGISSYAVELEGFGETASLKGHIDSFDVYLDDIRSLRDIIKRENGGKKVFLIGESMGALISFLAAGLNPGMFDGLILLSPAFKSRLRFSVPDYAKILFFAVFNPKKQVRVPFDAKMCTRDADYRKVMDADKREHRLATPRLLLNILLAAARANSLKGLVETPALFLVAADLDELTDPPAAGKVFNGMAARDKTIIEYPEMLHSLSIELGREKVFGDILSWVSNRL